MFHKQNRINLSIYYSLFMGREKQLTAKLCLEMILDCMFYSSMDTMLTAVYIITLVIILSNR